MEAREQNSTPSILPLQRRAVKSVKFSYNPTPMTLELLRTFRRMVNDAIRISLEEGICGRRGLRDRIYKQFQETYGIASCYPYSVAEVGWSTLKKHRKWHRKPTAKRLMMKMDAQRYSLNYSILSLPFKKGERILVPLKYGDYQRSFLMDSNLKRGAITVTEKYVIIAFTKETATKMPVRRIGIDLNEKSVVCSDGIAIDISEIARLHTEYGVRRREFNRRHHGDTKLEKKFSRASRERDRVEQILHRAAKQIVQSVKEKRQAIVMERLNGIRVAHSKGNGERRASRRRIALWPFARLQQYILYSAVWEGIPVEFVNARGSSKECHVCHYTNRKLKLADRSWLCPNCGCRLDRDFNAAINIERRGKIPCLGEVRPGAQSTNEVMTGNERTMAPIPGTEALKLT